MACIWIQQAYFQWQANSEPLQIYPLPYTKRLPQTMHAIVRHHDV
jgi:hypothetical protein